LSSSAGNTVGQANRGTRHSTPVGAPAAIFVATLLAASASAAEPARDEHAFTVHQVQSPYEAGTTEVRVLLPDVLASNRKYPVVYVLPVERGRECRYGDGLEEIRRRDLANRFDAIFVAPTFSHLPWYADHPTDPAIRQETHLLEVVLPLVEKHYPADAAPAGRLLLGFSKSGYGAVALLLRHPDVFGKAAAWDAPLMMERPDRYGMNEIFGSQENFERYEISRLLEKSGPDLGAEPRLILLSYGNFREHHQQAHELMTRLGIAHQYRDGPQRKHDWHSGWVEEAVELLFSN
jgi:S-formylglutathione hydrolase FrmB